MKKWKKPVVLTITADELHNHIRAAAISIEPCPLGVTYGR